MWSIRKVGKTFKRAYFGGIVSAQVEGETIQSTFHHPFWIVRGKELETRRLLDHLPPVPEGCQTEGRWVDACDMRVGDEVLLADGRIVPIQGISYSPFEGDVYNFQVEDLHSYSVGQAGVLVHNSYDENSLGAGLKYIKQITEEALETGVLKSLSKYAPLIRPKVNENHHIFTNFRKKWFKDEYGINVDNYIIAIDRILHEAFHAGKAALGNKAGWWDDTLMKMIRKAEDLKTAKLTTDEMLQVGRDMLAFFKLPNII